MQISSGGHPLGLVHRADGRVQALGQPGTLLGILPDPGLHDSRGLLRAGDSLVLFTDGITEARGPAGHGIYGEDRLRDVIAGLGDLPAARIADAIQQAALDYSGGASSDDTVTLVLKVRHPQTPGQPGSRPRPARRPGGPTRAVPRGRGACQRMVGRAWAKVHRCPSRSWAA